MSGFSGRTGTMARGRDDRAGEKGHTDGMAVRGDDRGTLRVVLKDNVLKPPVNQGPSLGFSKPPLERKLLHLLPL